MEKEFVLPGIKLSDNIKQAGYGTYIKDGNVYSALCGLVVRKQKISIIPFSGPYIPLENNMVISYLTTSTPSNWIFDIGAPNEAYLHATEFPFRVPAEKMSHHFSEGDVAILKVKEVKSDGTVELTFKDDPALKKLTTGNIVEISPWKVSRVIGRAGSMISMLESKTDCNIFVGHNGRVWIDGSAENMNILESALLYIDKNAHVSGLTDMVGKFIDDKYSALFKEKDGKDKVEKEKVGKEKDISDDNMKTQPKRVGSTSKKPRSYRLKSSSDRSVLESENADATEFEHDFPESVKSEEEEEENTSFESENGSGKSSCNCFSNFYF